MNTDDVLQESIIKTSKTVILDLKTLHALKFKLLGLKLDH